MYYTSYYLFLSHGIPYPVQYYFTIRDLRNAVMAFDTEGEINDTDWANKIIGGRKVLQSEVERARQCRCFFKVIILHLFYFVV
jgi:hypothetical protein